MKEVVVVAVVGKTGAPVVFEVVITTVVITSPNPSCMITLVEPPCDTCL